MRARWVLMAGLSALFLLLPPVGAAQFQALAWTTENGMPQNTVGAMAQTRDGYIWLATFDGLVRFDGARMVVFNPLNTPELRTSRIIELTVDRQGALWIGGEEGQVTRLFEGKFEAINGRPDLPPGPLSLRKSDPDGNAWIHAPATESLYRFENGKPVRAARMDAISQEQLLRLVGKNRMLWLKEKGEWRLVPETLVREPLAAMGHNFASVATESGDGDLWILTDKDWRTLRGGKSFPLQKEIKTAVQLLEDNDGNLLVATWREGLIALLASGEQVEIPLEGGDAARTVRTVFVDREGNRWVGTDVAGLQKVKAKVFQTLTRAHGLAGEVIRSVVCDARGNVFVVHQNGLDRIDANGTVRNRIADLELWSIALTEDKEIWTADSGGRVYRVEGTKTPVMVEPLRGARLISPAREGGVWVGSSKGLWHHSDTGERRIELPASAGVDVRAILDTGAHLWIGMYGGGLLRRGPDGWKQFGKAEGLNDPQIGALHLDATGALWVGTMYGGVNRFKNGKFANFSGANVSMPAHVSGILEDNFGYLWLTSLNGIHRVARADLDAVADGRRKDFFVQHFGKSDGLGTSECSDAKQPTICKTPDGRLWFATINGLSVVDPSQLPRSPRVPSVAIEEIVADGKRVTPLTGALGVLSLPPGASHLEIHYTALNVTDPERVRFKYRLGGLDRDWVDAGPNRIARYNHVGPGTFVFHALAANEDGIWNETGARVEIRLEPFFWESPVVRAGAAVGGIFIVAGIYLARLRALQRQQRLQQEWSRRLIESQETERKRIAGELHDGLGQDLLVIKNYALIGIAKKANGDASGFESISTTAAQALRQVREISYNLRPYQLDELGLTSALRGIFDRLNEGLIPFKVEIENIDGIFSAQDESHIFRITQELANNILKHSGATQAEIALRRGEKLSIRAQDNGSGMPDHVIAKGHGLGGLRERVRILRGDVRIFNLATGGTFLEISIPVPSQRKVGI